MPVDERTCRWSRLRVQPGDGQERGDHGARGPGLRIGAERQQREKRAVAGSLERGRRSGRPALIAQRAYEMTDVGQVRDTPGTVDGRRVPPPEAGTAPLVGQRTLPLSAEGGQLDGPPESSLSVSRA